MLIGWVLHYLPNHLGQEPGSYLRHTPLSQFHHCMPSPHNHWVRSCTFCKVPISVPSSNAHNSHIHSVTHLPSPASVSLAPVPPRCYWLCASLSNFQIPIVFFITSWNKIKFLNKTLHNMLLEHLNTYPEAVLPSGLKTQTQEPGN